MAQYTIEYQSQNIYTEEVSEGIFEFNISPCNDESQILIDETSKNSLNEGVFNFKNLFGFEVCRVRSANKFKDFTYTYRAKVQKRKMRMPLQSGFSAKDEYEAMQDPDFYIDHHLFLRKSAFTSIHPENMNKVPVFRNGMQVFEYLQLLNGHVHKLLTYQKNVTNVNTIADEAIKLKKGVCQDFAHIFIGMARCNGIPARYVSGYLNQGKKFVGSAFMHAWVEAYVPGMGWIGFDPTNKLMVDENFIKVSHGADYADCSPVKGVFRTNGDNKNTYHVRVGEQ